MNSERVFACGVTGSGKTHFLRTVFLPRCERIVVVDQTGEWIERYPHAPLTYGYADTADQLAKLANSRRWFVIASLDPEEIERLTSTLLMPSPNPRMGYPAKIGGMGILLDEVDILTPNGRAPASLRHLWRRGRHVGLSVYSATQRPANVSKEVTSQCQWLAILKQHEANDVDYLAKIVGRDVINKALEIVNRNPYACFLWNTSKREGYLIDRHGKERGIIRPAAFGKS